MDHIKNSYIKKCGENTGDDYNLKPMVRNFGSRSLLLSAKCTQTVQSQLKIFVVNTKCICHKSSL